MGHKAHHWIFATIISCFLSNQEVYSCDVHIYISLVVLPGTHPTPTKLDYTMVGEKRKKKVMVGFPLLE